MYLFSAEFWDPFTITPDILGAKIPRKKDTSKKHYGKGRFFDINNNCIM